MAQAKTGHIFVNLNIISKFQSIAKSSCGSSFFIDNYLKNSNNVIAGSNALTTPYNVDTYEAPS